MFYLLLSILASAGLNICSRLAEHRPGHSRSGMTFITQLAALFVSFAGVMGMKLFDPAWFSALSNELPVVISSGGFLSLPASYAYAMIMAAFGGLSSFGGMYFLQASIAANGSSMTVTFNKTGIVIPAVLSVVLFGEIPTAVQVIGILLGFAGIIMIYLKKDAISSVNSVGLLIMVLIMGGTRGVVNKFYESFGLGEGEKIYLVYAYIVASILSLALLIIKKEKPGLCDICYGTAAGIMLNMTSKFLLMAVRVVPGIIAFPLYSVGTILIVNVIGITVFRERLSYRQYAAMFLMAVSGILLNI